MGDGRIMVKSSKKKKISVSDLVPVAKLPLLKRMKRQKKVPVKDLKSYIIDEYKLVGKLDEELRATLKSLNTLTEKHEKLNEDYNAILVVSEELDKRVKSRDAEIQEYKALASELKLKIKELTKQHKEELADLRTYHKSEVAKLNEYTKGLEKEIKELTKPKNKKSKAGEK